MTTVQTRVRRIAEIEGFEITVRQNGSTISPTQNGILGDYPFQKMLKHTKTVADWKRERFESSYPGFTCDVLLDDGSPAPGQTTLRTVRESYEE